MIEHNWTAYLVLTEPLSENEASNGNESDDMSLIANNTGQLLRDCGARVFETTFLYNDHMPTADYPIIPENYDSLECVIKAVQDQGIRFDVEVRSPPRAADEIEVGN